LGANRNVTIHTAHDKTFTAVHPDGQKLILPINKDVLFLWSQCKFVDGIIFDAHFTPSMRVIRGNGLEFDSYFDERAPSRQRETNKGGLTLFTFSNSKLKKNKISDHINFKNFPKVKTHGEKIAVFQPCSFVNKRKSKIEYYKYNWVDSTQALLDKGYVIYVIGSKSDKEYCKEHHPWMFNNNKIITSHFGTIPILAALHLILKKATFVLGCDSWAAVYGIANGLKSIYASGWDTTHNRNNIHELFTYLGNMGNYLISPNMDKKKCDLQMANWINKCAE